VPVPGVSRTHPDWSVPRRLRSLGEPGLSLCCCASLAFVPLQRQRRLDLTPTGDFGLSFRVLGVVEESVQHTSGSGVARRVTGSSITPASSVRQARHEGAVGPGGVSALGR